MKCEPDCQWTYTGGDGKPWHCECGAVDMALQIASAESQIAEGRVEFMPLCDTDCPNAQEAMRLVVEAAELAESVGMRPPTAEDWAALKDLERRKDAIYPCPHCAPPRPAPPQQETRQGSE